MNALLLVLLLADPQPPFRVPLPATLPPHPRVFATAADLARVRRDLAAGDAYTIATVAALRGRGLAALEVAPEPAATSPTASHFSAAAACAEAWAVTGEAPFAAAGGRLLRAIAVGYPKLTTTPSHGRVSTNGTLTEGPLAVQAAGAYDLLYDQLNAADRELIERDLLRLMALECGHKCTHANSSNWRSWALTILAACGFATGDRALIDEALNGVWEPQRKLYLYGVVQQLQHSFFGDGIHWERSVGYTYYTASALQWVLLAAANSGIDLWATPVPSLLGPFEGSAPHEEYGPPGSRRLSSWLLAPYYLSFADGSVEQYGDSGTSALQYHPIYELAYARDPDPRYAWLLHRERQEQRRGLAGWDLWQPAGQSSGEVVPGGREGQALRLRTGEQARVAAVQRFQAPADRPVEVSGWVKLLAAGGAAAHLRLNSGDQALYTPSLRTAGDWQPVRVTLPPAANARPGDQRTWTLHVFLEGGAGEALWDALQVSCPGSVVTVANLSFDAAPSDGRRATFFDLLHAVREVPAGRFDLRQDSAMGLAGEHRNGASLFPVGGFALLRANPADPAAPAVQVAYGPYGSGHDHPDRLHLTVYGAGRILAADAGSWGYDKPDHVTWARQTVAHNTVVLDELSQQPQGSSSGVFVGERGDQRVFGELRCWHPGKQFQVLRTTCTTAYPNTLLDRTVAVAAPYVVDVMRVRSPGEHCVDLPLNALGSLTIETPTTPLTTPLTALGYRHWTAVRRATPPAGVVRGRFDSGSARLHLWLWHPGDGELLLAQTPAKGAPRSVLLSRQRAAAATFVTVLEPSPGAATVQQVNCLQTAGGLRLEIRHAAGEDALTLPEAVAGRIEWERQPAGGGEMERAQAAPQPAH
ncbi:MAG: heparinase II/III family protein [Fimbriimonadaceae bacterium]|nr:heparinase II/III family protein [Fimbriimonadaceae bacterium]